MLLEERQNLVVEGAVPVKARENRDIAKAMVSFPRTASYGIFPRLSSIQLVIGGSDAESNSLSCNRRPGSIEIRRRATARARNGRGPIESASDRLESCRVHVLPRTICLSPKVACGSWLRSSRQGGGRGT